VSEMGVKEEAKTIVSETIGPLNAQKIDGMDASNPKEFIDNVEMMISNLLGSSIASAKVQKLRDNF
jgi:hypothetical protein